MSRYLRANIIRTVRLLPEAVRVGAPPAEQEESELSPAVLAPDEESSELSELQREKSRLLSELEDARRENRDLSARMALFEKEIAQEKGRLASERETMLASNRAECEALREKAAADGAEEGRNAGYAEGIENARKEISREYEEKVSSLVSLLEEVYSSLASSTDELAALRMPRLLRLWELMLSKMLHREVIASGDTVLPVMRTLLERLSSRDRILVYLHPEDVDVASGRKDAFGDLLRGVKHFEFIPDSNVERGSCIVETNLGIYDARWRTQLEQIHKEIDHLFIEGRKDDGENG